MKSTLSHLQVNIDFANIEFYKKLMVFLGWKEIFSDETVAGYANGQDGSSSVWFLAAPENTMQNYDAIGMNHIGISVPNQSDVDETVAYLKENDIEPLFDTPRHRSEFAMSEGETYYQVMFASPDKILFEVVYTGPKSK